ncbi:MAG: hypothetical protein EPN93_02595 [Spirochaetes bacterium]|nr:MAG: hypothetical protein EPN93_02595 [Spirochaetota bacterium]
MKKIKDITRPSILFEPVVQGEYPITETDWNRLKEMVKTIKPENRVFNFISALCFGVFGNSIFMILSLCLLEKLPPWMIPTSVATAFVTIVLGVAFFKLDMSQKVYTSSSSSAVVQEMDRLESRFETGINIEQKPEDLLWGDYS